MDGLSSTEGIVAVAGAAAGLCALVLAIVLAVKLRRLRAAQTTILGPDGARDLVAHAARIEQAFTDLRDWVEDASERLDARMAGTERRMDGAFAHSALVRYDAYGEMSGHQSSSFALLDSARNGIVVSSILHRENARVYVKAIAAGESELELSPEERRAVDEALAAPVAVHASQ